VSKTGLQAFRDAFMDVGRPLCVVRHEQGTAVVSGAPSMAGYSERGEIGTFPAEVWVPPLPPEYLGSPDARRMLGLRYAYIVGAMANGITSVEMVGKMGRGGMLGIFGAGGLTLSRIETAIGHLQTAGEIPWGINLIHSPANPDLEKATAELFLRRDVPLVSASAFMGLTLPLVYLRVRGMRRDEQGRAVPARRLIAKVSRLEVGRKFLSPPPEKLLRELLSAGLVSEEEARLAAVLPMADCITAEADSGGHTDNRPALTLLPTIMALRDDLQEKYAYRRRVEVGLGGGIATPQATAAAFAMGAAYVLAGSIHQATLEAGTSPTVRKMLAQTRQADIAMCPSADMFEMGVKVQVLKRGTMFPLRASRLYELYNTYDRWEEIPADQRGIVEKEILRTSFESAWQQTRAFFEQREPAQVQAALERPRHKMALVFRSYLGQASGWAVSGVPDRRIDYQIWCGPAMGAFNQWVRDSFLESPDKRDTVTVAMNLMFGAAVLTRANWARLQGAALPPGSDVYRPLKLKTIQRWMAPADRE